MGSKAVAKPAPVTAAPAVAPAPTPPVKVAPASPAEVLAAIASTQWAVRAEMLRTMVTVAAQAQQGRQVTALASEQGEWLENAWTATTRDGIATIPVRGIIRRYASWSWWYGGTGYDLIAQDLQTAVDDPAVRAIILDIDSQGGDVNGMIELAGLIRAADDVKPVWSYIGGMGCSAGYGLASGARRIVVASTAIVGSLGVRLTAIDFSKLEEKLGIETIEITSSQTPNKARDPATKAGRTAAQVLVDDLATVFIETVAEYNGVDVETLLASSGEGAEFVGAKAVEAGLADAVGTYEEMLAELQESVAPTSATLTLVTSASSRPSGRAPISAKTNMATRTPRAGRRGAQPLAAAASTDPTAGSGATTTTADDEEEDDMTDEEKKQQEEATEARVKTAATAAATAERTRVLGIQALAGDGEDAIVTACVNDPACSIADAALKLRQAEAKTRSAALTALAADETGAPAPKTPATKGANGDEPSVESLSDRIFSAGRPAPRTPSTRDAR